MSNINLSPVCKTSTKRRMERYIIRSTAHPALQNPYKFSIDTSKQLAVMVIVSLLTVLTWQTYVQNASHAIAPTEGISLGHASQ